MKNDVGRREFITLLGGAVVARPVAPRAQPRALPVIGVLGSGTAAAFEYPVAVVRQALKDGGFVEGQNIAIEQRWADDQYQRLPDMAVDLVRRRVSLIVTFGNNLPARAAKAATATIPIVFTMGADPVQLGLVASLNRPGGNITGVTLLASDMVQKRLQLLHDAVPAAKVFGFIVNPDNSGPISSGGRTETELAHEAVRGWGGTIEVAQARTIDDFETAIASLVERRIEALTTSPDQLFFSGVDRLVALAARNALPMILGDVSAKAGALMEYNARASDAFLEAGRYAARILKGEKPADLPVLLPTKFEFIINLKTAKTLGLTIPPGLLAIVDAVIE